MPFAGVELPTGYLGLPRGRIPNIRAAQFAVPLAAAAAQYAANKIAGSAKSYVSSLMAPIPRRRRYIAPYKRRYRTSRRYGKKKRAGRNGRRFAGKNRMAKKISLGRRLNTRISAKDTLRVRGRADLTSFTVRAMPQEILGANWPLQASYFETFLDNKDRYEEFKITNVQYVLSPKNPAAWNQNPNVSVANACQPFIFLRPRESLDRTVALPGGYDTDDLLRTPGMQKISIGIKRDAVVNHTPLVQVQTQYKAGLDDTTVKEIIAHRKMPWMDCQSDAATQFCPVQWFVPYLRLGDTTEIHFTLAVYATFMFRGRKTPEIVPDHAQPI